MKKYLVILKPIGSRSAVIERFQRELIDELDRRIVDENQLEMIGRLIDRTKGDDYRAGLDVLVSTPTGYSSGVWWSSKPKRVMGVQLILTRGPLLE